MWLGVQAFINMGVNMGVLPTKGLTLPLMSFGGSSIVASCITLAVFMRVGLGKPAVDEGLTDMKPADEVTNNAFSCSDLRTA